MSTGYPSSLWTESPPTVSRPSCAGMPACPALRHGRLHLRPPSTARSTPSCIRGAAAALPHRPPGFLEDPGWVGRLKSAARMRHEPSQGAAAAVAGVFQGRLMLPVTAAAAGPTTCSHCTVHVPHSVPRQCSSLQVPPSGCITAARRVTMPPGLSRPRRSRAGRRRCCRCGRAPQVNPSQNPRSMSPDVGEHIFSRWTGRPEF